MRIKSGDAVIDAMTNLKSCASLSPTEAEYSALTEAVKTIVWLKTVLLALGVDQNSSHIFQDNVNESRG